MCSRIVLRGALAAAILVVQATWLTTCDAGAEIPQVIAYQGRLTEDTGKPLIGAHAVTFRFYAAESGGNDVWEEVHQLEFAPKDNGIFSITLGNRNPLNVRTFNQPLWLSLEIDGEGEMTPRLRLTASGYAINADTVDGFSSEQFLRVNTDVATSGRLTLTHSGVALVIAPDKAVPANTALVEVREVGGAPRFTVDSEGDVTIGGSLTVAGAIQGAAVTGGTVTQVDAGAGLSGGPIMAAGTLAIGQGAGIVVGADDVAGHVADRWGRTAVAGGAAGGGGRGRQPLGLRRAFGDGGNGQPRRGQRRGERAAG